MNITLSIDERIAEAARKAAGAMATLELMVGALDLRVLHSLSFYDALILRAAMVSGCQQLLTEDMQYGASFGGVRIVNPFLAS